MALGSRLSELKIQTSLCQTTSFAHRCCAGGWGGPGQPSELGHTQHTSNLEQRKPSLLARCRARNSIARADHHRQHRVARACVPIDVIVPLKRPTTHTPRHTRMLRDHPTIRSKLNLGFDCDTTKGALWRFGEAAHLLISQRSVRKCNGRSNLLRMRNNQSGCVARMCSHSNRTNSNM